MTTRSPVETLCCSDNPIIAYRTRRLIAREDADGAAMVKLRNRIRSSEAAQRLLSHREPDGTIRSNPYRKWQGPHWTLYSLAQIDYPPGDESLEAMRDQVYEWLLAPEHLEFPRSLVIPGQEERVRRCTSQEGNAIWYSLMLGLVDERTRIFVDRLIELQWPDGGWNCDKRPEARSSSVTESLIPLRALVLYGKAYGYRPALECAARAAEYFLKRRLLYRLSDGALIPQAWGGDIDKIHFPIQFCDVLFALVVMREIGMASDERCSEARDLLASKRLADGGFAAEVANCTTSDAIVTRGSFADWGPTGKRISNPLVTIQALFALGAA